MKVWVRAKRDEWTTPLDGVEEEMEEDQVLGLFDFPVYRLFTEGKTYEGWIDVEGRWIIEDDIGDYHVVNGKGYGHTFVHRFVYKGSNFEGDKVDKSFYRLE